MDLMEQGGVLTDPELAPLAAAFQQTLMTSPVLAHRRRLRRDHAQHHRRARARPAAPTCASTRTLPFNQLPTGKKK